MTEKEIVQNLGKVIFEGAFVSSLKLESGACFQGDCVIYGDNIHGKLTAEDDEQTIDFTLDDIEELEIY